MRSRRNTVLAATLAAVMAAGPIAVPAAALEPLTIGTTSLKDATLRLYGFVETDNIYDTTQSYTEEQDSVAPQARNVITSKSGGATGATNPLGTRGRDEMSVRNSRLGMELNVPAQDNGISARAVFEIDFLGNNGGNELPGTTSVPSQSEGSFFNNPTARVRHAYVDVSKILSAQDLLSAKLGQTWSLLGWQPYYFPGEAIVQPGVGQLYRRFVQARATETHTLGDWTLESAADAAKPAEMNSGSPEWHAGARVASTKYKGATIAGASTQMIGLSAGVSGALIPIRTQSIGSPTGNAIALDVLVPIIPSADGKSRDNTLVWAAEGVTGSGLGGLEMAGLTFGVPGIAAATSNSGTAIDSGIAGLNASGNVELIRMRGYRTHLQYTLTKWSASVGYAQVEARNLDRFGAGSAAYALYPKLQYGYVSAFYDAATWLRFGAEINQTKATFNDPNNRFARNNRYQTSAYFMF
jgi:hypothetical protein